MAETEKGEKKKPSAIMGLIKAAAVVTVLVVIELVAVAMVVPSAEETEELAQKLALAAKGEKVSLEESEGEETISFEEETVEVELLTDNLTRFNPETNATLNVQFSVYGVVLAEEVGDFETQFNANTNRIHEQIMLTMHGAETADLASVGLGLIKRQILEKTNRTLGRPLLREVVFTKLNFIER